MVTVTVYKDEAKLALDTRKTAKMLGLDKGNEGAWEEAKKTTSKIDYTQSFNPGPSFFDNAVSKKLQDLGASIAAGRNYTVSLT